MNMDVLRLYDAFKECGQVTTDSRAVRGGEMFFALKGESFDGNEYARAALGAGARYAVVEEGTVAAVSGDPRVIAVPDTLASLQALARHHRENTFVDGKRLTVIGLTGTNGKTTTKELITKVLSVKYNVTSTQGNLNNDIGVPLSVLRIDSRTQVAVIEMGASHPGDIGKLVSVCEPDYGLITNVGKAHLLGFGSFEGVKRAKGELFDYIQNRGGSVFLNADDADLAGMAASRGGLNVIEYGLEYWGALVLPSDADHPYVRMAVPDSAGVSPVRQASGAIPRAPESSESSEILLPVETHLAGSYNAANIASAIAVGLHFGVTLEEAIQAVSEYVPKNNRSQLEKTDRNILIVDAYNANPTSMAAALENLSAVQARHKAVMLGDMRELGADSVSEHMEVVSKLSSMNPDLVCLVGEEFRKALDGFLQEHRQATEPFSSVSPVAESAGVSGFHWFPASDDLLEWLKSNPVSDHTVLVKGSRGIRMERILPAL